MAAPEPTKETPAEVNLGIADGDVAHADINGSIAGADCTILFGQQTRLPHFPDDRRLPRLHAADPLVLFFWRVLKKVPEFLREALVDGPLSITLVRGDNLLHFRDVRYHQAVHIGRRRQTIYLPEILLRQAEERGYNHWSIAEGVIYASWMLFDYLLLADLLTDFGERARGPGSNGTAGSNVAAALQRAGATSPPGRTSGGTSGLRLSEALLRRLVLDHNRHRRVHPDAAKSETEEFIEGYRRALIRVQGVNTWTHEPWEIARDVFHPELERRWAKAKMERIADMFEYPRMFLLDRDIIHGVALDLALRQGHNIEPVSFADALHDYRDAQRFDPRPLMTEFCKGIVTKPRAVFLTTVVDLGAAGLRGFFHAYRDNVMEAHDLIHALWSYLVSLSSDPAGVYSRVGKCRALCRPPGARIAGGRARPSENVAAPVGDLDRELAGILIRLDRRPDYRQKSREIVGLGDTAREELLAVITHHGLAETDEWATFKIKKQVIVSCACELLDEIDGGDRDTLAQLGDRRRVHEDEAIIKLLVDHPHRQTSDPSGVLLYARSYARTLATFGASDPDASFQLASVLVRLDLSDAYEALLARIPSLGPPAVSALYEVLDQVSERDERRRPILQRARQLLGSILLEKKQRSQASQRALRVSQGVPVSELSAGAADNDRGGVAAQVTPVDGFVSLYRELLTGTAFLQRGGLDGTQPAAADGEQANDEEHGSGAEV